MVKPSETSSKSTPPHSPATRQGTSSDSGTLTPSELASLRHNGNELIAFAQKAFPPKTKG